MSPWSICPLGEIAPACETPFPGADQVVWNLSLDEIEAHTGRVLATTAAKVADLGSSKCAFDSGNVLYSKLRPYLNKVVLPDQPGVGTSELIPLRPRPDKLDREFLAWYLRSPEFLEFAAQNTRGANLPRIAMAELWLHRVPVPPLPEQHRIVVRIQELMGRVGEVQSLSAAVAKQRAMVFSASLTRIASADWPQAQLCDLAKDIRNGWSGKEMAAGRKVDVLKLSAVHGMVIKHTESREAVVADRDAKGFLVERHDVYVVRGNGSKHLVGRGAIADQSYESLIFNDLLIRIRPNRQRLLPEFLNFALAMPAVRRQMMTSAQTAAGIWKINQGGLGRVMIPCPGLSQQFEFVAAVQELQASCAGLDRGIGASDTDRVRAAILRKAFAGEL